jgi:hypothetical protein
MNMDYALSEALRYTTHSETPGIIFAYDVNCQYSINLRRRIAEGPYLSIPTELPILPAIGLFHVHGHQDRCYPRYAPTFVRGIGKADGEILETNWGVLNGISPTTRTMTLAHRAEVMDAHIADSNWKKTINMSMSLHKVILLLNEMNMQLRHCVTGGSVFVRPSWNMWRISR